jgi:hypothetical protein
LRRLRYLQVEGVFMAVAAPGWICGTQGRLGRGRG